MKEITNIAANIFAAYDQDKGTFRAVAETCLMLYEPKYRMADGKLEKGVEVETIRFAAGPEALRGIAKRMLEYADLLDAHDERLKEIDDPMPAEESQQPTQ